MVTADAKLREPESAEGPEEEVPLGRRLLAEFLGTLLLVAVGAGAATVFVLGPARGFASLGDIISGAPGQDVIFSSLLANSIGDTLAVAFAFATILSVVVYLFGGISGGHFNPAVTSALALTRRFAWKDVLPYWLFQCLGGIVGAFVIAGIYGQNGAAIGGVDILFGATRVSEGVNQFQAILSEAFVTFVLMIAIMGFATNPKVRRAPAGVVIGLALAGGIIVTATATGGSANFARSLGPFVASWAGEQFLNYKIGDIPWDDLLIYFAGPLVGAGAAALLYESVAGLPPAPPGRAEAKPFAAAAPRETPSEVKQPWEPTPEPATPPGAGERERATPWSGGTTSETPWPTRHDPET